MTNTITQSDIEQLNEVALTVEKGDLYNALHYVGDDPVKADIEDALRQVLDEPTFNKVVAVFKIITTDE